VFAGASSKNIFAPKRMPEAGKMNKNATSFVDL
jgi:hypothetical protein